MNMAAKSAPFLSTSRLLALAPMEDITDSPFRRICRRLGADIVYSEFVSSEGLIRDAKKSLKKLLFTPSERPIGIQIYGHDVESMRLAALMAESYDPDFIDINAGCPVKKLVNKGACAALLKDLPLLARMTHEVVKSVRLPVTVKMRIGWDSRSIVAVDAARMLEDAGVSALAIHGRTRDQAYRGTANWDMIAASAAAVSVPVIGNGDIRLPEDALQRFQRYPEIAGIMIGRGAIGVPWLFDRIHNLMRGEEVASPPFAHRVALLKEHILYSVEERGERLGVMTMRKHFSGYLKGEPMVAQLRSRLMQFYEVEPLFAELDDYLQSRSLP